ncbi:MAG: YcxB family protein [Fluviicola sp.]
MEPRITTKYYMQSASEFAGLFAKELLRRSWFVVIPLILIGMTKPIYDAIKNNSVLDLIPVGIMIVIFFYVRFRYLQKLKSMDTFHRERVLRVFDDYLEQEEDSGSIGKFLFTDIHKISPLKNNYRVKMKNNRFFWIPKDAFNTNQDRQDFEAILLEKGLLK